MKPNYYILNLILKRLKMNIAINNKKTKQWVLYIITISLQAWAFISNPFRKNKITHLFFYSNDQDGVIEGMFYSPYSPYWSYMEPKPDTYIKGRKYSEMREIGKGFSNWEDAVIVGVGGHSDVRLNKTQ
jgi:hypothetical protein